MRKILGLLIASVLLLTGCSSNTTTSKSEELYKDLSAKETIEKACNYFNEEVDYFVTKEEAQGLNNKWTNILERKKNNGKVDYIRKYYYEGVSNNKNSKQLNYEVLSSKRYKTLSGSNQGEGTLQAMDADYEAFENNYKVPYFIPVWEKIDKVEIMDIIREEKNGEIFVTCKFKYDYEYNTDQGEKKTKTNYRILKTIIGENGLINEEEVSSYVDDTYTKVITKAVGTYTDINKKTSIDYDEEIKVMERLVGKTIDEGKEKLGL